MQEEAGIVKVAMPKAYLKVRVHVKMKRKMYEHTGLPMNMRSSMTKQGKLLRLQALHEQKAVKTDEAAG